MADQGLFHWPGANQVLSGQFTLSHGISPSVATLKIIPSSRIATQGTLQITYGSVRLQFPGAIADLSSLDFGRGTEQTIRILDRRWRWRFGGINGFYNVRKADGTLLREKTPQQLAILLLKAMSEPRFDVNELPNVTRPVTTWDEANPAQSLAELAESLGCRIVLGLDNVVRIRRLGRGRLLPTSLALSASVGIDSAESPSVLKFVGAPTLVESKLKLQAVGVDIGGKILAIDDLPYKPADGWETVIPSSNDLVEKIVTDADRERARESVFRWYQVVSQVDDTQKVPGFGPVDDIEQIFPILSTRLEKTTELTKEPGREPAKITGTWAPDGGAIDNVDGQVDESFQIDGERGLVIFSRPVFKYGADDLTKPADLVLQTSYSVSDSDTGVPLRGFIRRPILRNGGGEKPVVRDEIGVELIADYDSNDRVTGVRDNFDDFRLEANRQLDAVQAGFQRVQTAEAPYAGIVPIEPDGAIQQVSWTVGPQGATTRASRNSEFSLVVPSFAERRRREKVNGDAIDDRIRQALEFRRRAARHAGVRRP